MKKTKIIIPALGMLLLSTAASVTGTVAWFAMNSTVAATGMQIKVNSQNTYLLIGTGDNDTCGEIQNLNSTTAALTVLDDEASVAPSHPANSTQATNLLNTTDGLKVGGGAITVAGSAVVDNTTAAACTNWYTATAEAPDDEAMLAGTARQLVTFDGYVIVRHAYLTVAVGSSPVTNIGVTGTILPAGFSKLAQATTAVSGDIYYSLTNGVFSKLETTAGETSVPAGSYAVTAASGASTIDLRAVRVMVATDDNSENAKAFTILDISKNDVRQDIKGANTNLTSALVRTVDVYLYIDGEDESVYTNNIPNLADASIELSFDASLAA